MVFCKTLFCSNELQNQTETYRRSACIESERIPTANRQQTGSIFSHMQSKGHVVTSSSHVKSPGILQTFDLSFVNRPPAGLSDWTTKVLKNKNVDLYTLYRLPPNTCSTIPLTVPCRTKKFTYVLAFLESPHRSVSRCAGGVTVVKR